MVRKTIKFVSKSVLKVSYENKSHFIRYDTPPIGALGLCFIFGIKAHKTLLGDYSGTCSTAFGVQKFKVEERIISWQTKYLSSFVKPHSEREIHLYLQVFQAKRVEMNFLGLFLVSKQGFQKE